MFMGLFIDHSYHRFVAFWRTCWRRLCIVSLCRQPTVGQVEKRYLDISSDDLKKTRQLIKWKEHVITEWDNLVCRSIENQNHPNSTYYIGDKLSIEAALECGSLTPNDLKVELILVDNEHEGETKLVAKDPFEFLRKEGENNIFKCEVDAKKVGNWSYAIRVIPANELLPHDLDFNLVKWF